MCRDKPKHYDSKGIIVFFMYMYSVRHTCIWFMVIMTNLKTVLLYLTLIVSNRSLWIKIHTFKLMNVLLSCIIIDDFEPNQRELEMRQNVVYELQDAIRKTFPGMSHSNFMMVSI